MSVKWPLKICASIKTIKIWIINTFRILEINKSLGTEIKKLWYCHSYGNSYGNIYSYRYFSPGKQNWDFQNKPIYPWSIGFWEVWQYQSVGMNSLFNRQCWHNWISTCRRMTVGPLPQPHTKITLKLINNLNVRAKIIDFTFGNEFLDMTSKEWVIKAKIGKVNFKMENLCALEDMTR